MRYIVAIASLVIIVLLGGGILLFTSQQHSLNSLAIWIITRQLDSRISDNAETVTFVVNKGETAASIAARLQQEKLITSGFVFSTLAKLRGVDAHIEAGEYRLRRSMSMSEVLDELQNNRYSGSRITIPEGWRVEQIADLLQQRGLARREVFLALVNSASFNSSLGADFLRGRPAGVSLEGYLFPDTYLVPPDASANEIIKQMVDNFGQRFDQSMREEAARSRMSIHQVVTLASIVEREAQLPAERPIIASVFLNRIKADMPLQSDVTVQYVAASLAEAGDASGNYWSRSLAQADFQLDSPYNTYQYKGLPPGPISNPGLASIKAVLEPANTDYYYFVESENGAHAFARTLQEHLDNVVKYEK